MRITHYIRPWRRTPASPNVWARRANRRHKRVVTMTIFKDKLFKKSKQYCKVCKGWKGGRICFCYEICTCCRCNGRMVI